RCRTIKLFKAEKEYDRSSGIEVGEKEYELPAEAVITEMSIKGEGSRYYEDGIEYEEGDIKIDVKLEYLTGNERKIIRVNFDGKDYEILGGDLKGIGRRNRIEYLGREIS